MFWSPAGQYIVIAEIRDSGALEFVDTADFTTMCSTEHYKATDIEWDPTGRFVATGVSSWKTKVCYTFYYKYMNNRKCIKLVKFQ